MVLFKRRDTRLWVPRPGRLPGAGLPVARTRHAALDAHHPAPACGRHMVRDRRRHHAVAAPSAARRGPAPDRALGGGAPCRRRTAAGPHVAVRELRTGLDAALSFGRIDRRQPGGPVAARRWLSAAAASRGASHDRVSRSSCLEGERDNQQLPRRLRGVSPPQHGRPHDQAGDPARRSQHGWCCRKPSAWCVRPCRRPDGHAASRPTA